jgi:hypothetical protein
MYFFVFHLHSHHHHNLFFTSAAAIGCHHPRHQWEQKKRQFDPLNPSAFKVRGGLQSWGDDFVCGV